LIRVFGTGRLGSRTAKKTAREDQQMPGEDEDPQRTYNFWLGRTLRELRDSKKIARSEIAWHVPGEKGKPIDVSTLSHFENGKTFTRTPDSTVAAYALLCGVDDARDLWAEALRQWIKLGGVPMTGRNLTPAVRARLLAQEASQRTAPYAVESQDKPTSIRKRRRAG
jgi:hypothetical protein